MGLPVAVARIVSVFFHPVVLPLLAAIALLNSDTYVSYSITHQQRSAIYAVTGISTCILPILSALIFLRAGIIRSLQMESRDERRLPFLITACSYSAGYWLLARMNLPPVIHLLQLGATLAVVVLLVVNMQWKISAHAAGLGGFAGALLALAVRLDADFFYLFMAAVLAAGVTASSRLILGSHRPAQVYAGFAAGMCCEIVTILLAGRG